VHEPRPARVDGIGELQPLALEEALAGGAQVVWVDGCGHAWPALIRDLGLGLAKEDGSLFADKLHQRFLGEADICGGRVASQGVGDSSAERHKVALR
jgi:hypothetical protein